MSKLFFYLKPICSQYEFYEETQGLCVEGMGSNLDDYLFFSSQDGKLRHMAELQRSVVADPETRQQLAQQIATWEENIERLHCEQFRLRCYMASLQGGELPNPKVMDFTLLLSSL